jgi:hypothetical protein
MVDLSVETTLEPQTQTKTVKGLENQLNFRDDSRIVVDMLLAEGVQRPIDHGVAKVDHR